MIRRQVLGYLRTWNTALMTPPPPPPPNGGTVTAGRINLENFDRIKGQCVCDVTGTVTINFSAVAGPGAVDYTAAGVQDLSQLPAIVYTWDEEIVAPYVEIIFTNTSGGPATKFSAFNDALPE